jgi:FMN phosphatase YigB (HAD superfamily)
VSSKELIAQIDAERIAQRNAKLKKLRAYPKLIAFVREVANRVPLHVAGDGATERARQLLRSLGEIV